MKINIRMTESYTTYVIRDSFVIDTDDYPELQGMSEVDMMKYVHENSETMEHKEWEQSLWDAASEMDVLRDKITDDTRDFHVEALVDGHPIKIK
jgi:hypothetical protein